MFNKFLLNIIYRCKDYHLLPKKKLYFKFLWKIYIFFNLNKYINIIFINKKKMCNLNFMYKKNNSCTDILSFNNIKIKNVNNIFLGDIFLCPLYIFEKNNKNKCKYIFNLNRILIHGLLHLLGFSHKKIENYKNMKIFELFFLYYI